MTDVNSAKLAGFITAMLMLVLALTLKPTRPNWYPENGIKWILLPWKEGKFLILITIINFGFVMGFIIGYKIGLLIYG